MDGGKACWSFVIGFDAQTNPRRESINASHLASLITINFSEKAAWQKYRSANALSRRNLPLSSGSERTRVNGLGIWAAM